MLEQDKQIMSDYANARKGGIRFELPARHARPMPTKPIFSSLMPFSETSPRLRYQISILRSVGKLH
jgi:hypothetical protein